MKKTITLLFSVLISLSAFSQDVLKAAFTAQEVLKQVYKQSFDTEEDIQGWTAIPTNPNSTWHLNRTKKTGLPQFSAVDPTSVYSLALYADGNNVMNENLFSPYFTIDKPTFCKFYSAFDGPMGVHGSFIINVEKQSGGDPVKIFDAFMWSQETGHTRHKWLEFEINLEQFINENIRFVFSYAGAGGDDVYVDNFCLYEMDFSEDAKVFIHEGQQVHFQDMSEGNPTSWQWNFDGGTPQTSSEKNPVVSYTTAGIYEVKLTISNGNENDELTKTAFVNVQGVAPIVSYALPETSYLSPEASVFIPRDYVVTFLDKSGNMPTAWLWNLPGSDVLTSTEQNPRVTYPEAGRYGISLRVTNQQGIDTTEPGDTIQVGGKCHIWNIGMEESSFIDEIVIHPLFGYYGGSNSLGMLSYAEEFKKPMMPAQIYSVDIYFSKADVIDPPVNITVSVASLSDGKPGETLGSASLSSDNLKCDPAKWVPTTFTFDQPVSVDDVFVIVVDGIPGRYNENTYEMDDVAMAGIRRALTAERKSTTYHLLEEWDGNDQPTGKTYWTKNDDENISFALAPRMQFKNDTPPAGITTTSDEKPLLFVDSKTLMIVGSDGLYDVNIYNLQGVQIACHVGIVNSVSMPYDSGIYIVQLNRGEKTYSYKVKL